LGWAFGLKKDWRRAEGTFQRAIEVSQENQLTIWRFYSCINRAEVARFLGEFETAVQNYQKAAEVGRKKMNASLSGLSDIAAGKAALLNEDLDSAGSFFRTALVDFSEKWNHHSLGPCLESMAEHAAKAGRFDRAVRLAGFSAARRWQKDPTGMPWYISSGIDDLLASARRALDEEKYAQLLAAGKAMSLDEAVAFALEDLSS
jgi:tetratricopeptide (TPR) repeat protein